MHDLLLENARIIDGSGSPWFRGAVTIDDDKITSIIRNKKSLPEADSKLDANEKFLCPGFIDTHSHSDIQLFQDPSLAPKTRQGVTTEILGQDGFSVAPVSDDRKDEWRRQLGPLAGDADSAWNWNSISEYLEVVNDHGIAPNVATLVGHGTVRHEILGMADRKPGEDEIIEMADLVEEGLQDGAVGFSTGLVYTPQSYSGTVEVERLASTLNPYQRPFVAHIRSERSRIWQALDEFIDIGAKHDIPLHVSHFKVGGPPQFGKAYCALTLLEIARERGIDITAEVYPYMASSTTLTYVLPPWVYSEGSETALQYLTDEKKREEMRKDIKEYRVTGWENPGEYSDWENIVVNSADATTGEEGKSIQEIAIERNTDPVSVVCDLLYENDLEVSIINHFLEEGDVEDILESERVNIASDGLFGGKPHPRVYGTFPRTLGNYARDENLFSIEEGVRKMTSLPARIMNLQRKGLIRPGMDADLVVFDPQVISSPATYENPKQYPRGISEVMINGEFVVRGNEPTGSRPGRALTANST